MAKRRRYSNISDLPAVIPVFPLTGAMLFPRTRLPLNVFEPRYLTMVDAAMDGDRLIGMIQPKTAGEDMAPKPALCGIGCVGRIVEYSETEDGRYLITLAGMVRFRLAGEREAGTPFRQVAADYAAFAADMATVEDQPIPRERLLAALKPYLKDREMKSDWDSIEEAPGETLVSALSMICPFGPQDKQALLEAPTLKDRAEALIALLEIANASSSGGGKQPVH
jgi:Lon protease-like protein